MGHKGNRCQTEYGDATWRTIWRWRRSAVSDCVLVFATVKYLTHPNAASTLTRFDQLIKNNQTSILKCFTEYLLTT